MYLNDDQYVYVIAGGKTLEVINTLKQDSAEARTGLEALAARYGATVSHRDPSPYQDIPYFTFKGQPPAPWYKTEGDMSLMKPSAILPDQGRAGRELYNEIKSLAERGKLQDRFNAACKNACGLWMGANAYAFEEVGDKTIVKCPPSEDRHAPKYRIPPDSTVISYAAYIGMKEAAGLLPERRAEPFAKPFGP
jgi:hypothetical protein